MNNLTIKQLKSYFLITILIVLLLVIIVSLYKEYLLNKKVVELFDGTITTTPESVIKEVINTNDNNLLKTMDGLMNNQMLLDKLTNKINKLKSNINELGISLNQTMPKEELNFF